MKIFFKNLSIAFLSAFCSVYVYDQFFQTGKDVERISNMQPLLMPTNYNFNTNSYAAEATDFTAAAEKTVNAVVHVKNTGTAGDNSPSLYRYFYGEEDVPERIGTGSGVIVSPDGYIITNYHVIENNNTIEITTNDNKTYDAKVIGTDPDTDIAVLKIDADQKLPYVFFGNSDTTRIGEWVLAVGNPFNLNSTVTAGIISAKSRDLNKRDRKNESYIQTDAAVNRGNSGGALVNTNGELIGINTAISSMTGGYVGYSFAVPSNVARKVFEDIIEYGDVQRGLLGVIGQALDAQMAARFEVEETEGFYITDLEKGLGADLAGLKANDIIKSVDGIVINEFADLSGYLASKRPGEKVSVIYKRAGKEKEVSVRLEKINRAVFYFMELRPLSPEQKKKYKTDHGLYIFNMNNRRLYQRGIDNQYIILEINGKKVSSLSDIKNIDTPDIEDILFLSPTGEKKMVLMQY